MSSGSRSGKERWIAAVSMPSATMPVLRGAELQDVVQDGEGPAEVTVRVPHLPRPGQPDDRPGRWGRKHLTEATHSRVLDAFRSGKAS